MLAGALRELARQRHDGIPPARLRVFRAADGDPLAGNVDIRLALCDEHQIPEVERVALARTIAARRRWTDARGKWATEHGYLPAAPYGSAPPGRSWWDFLRLCRDHTTDHTTDRRDRAGLAERGSTTGCATLTAWLSLP